MRYPGGKAKSYHQILNLIPPHDTYIEPFLGVGSVMRNKKRARCEIGVDLDERALEASGLRHLGIELLRADGIEYIRNFRFQGDEVVYCDPPYLPETRRSKRVYRFDADESQHQYFLETVCSIDARVLVSGYESGTYNKALNGWNVHRFTSKTHVDVREECIWFNFPRPVQLHDYRHLGHNYRERQTIKRRLDRIRNRISHLSEQEQEYIREWLNERGNSHAA